MRKYTYKGGVNERRKTALKRLDKDLSSSTSVFDKLTKQPLHQGESVQRRAEHLAFLGNRIDRMQQESTTLKSRIK